MIYFVKLCRMTKHLFGGPQPHRWPPYETFAETVKSAKRCRCACCLLKWCSSDVIFSDRVVVECRVWCWLRSLSLKKRSELSLIQLIPEQECVWGGLFVYICMYMCLQPCAPSYFLRACLEGLQTRGFPCLFVQKRVGCVHVLLLLQPPNLPCGDRYKAYSILSRHHNDYAAMLERERSAVELRAFLHRFITLSSFKLKSSVR